MSVDAYFNSLRGVVDAVYVKQGVDNPLPQNTLNETVYTAVRALDFKTAYPKSEKRAVILLQAQSAVKLYQLELDQSGPEKENLKGLATRANKLNALLEKQGLARLNAESLRTSVEKNQREIKVLKGKLEFAKAIAENPSLQPEHWYNKTRNVVMAAVAVALPVIAGLAWRFLPILAAVNNGNAVVL